MKVQVDICSVKNVEQSNGDVDTERERLYGEIEDWSICDTWQEVYKAALKQYGRCVSKIYVTQKKEDKHIGWCFEKRVKYDDCNETYLQEAWIVPLKSHEIKTIVEYAL